jgi:hypothetical protein
LPWCTSQSRMSTRCAPARCAALGDGTCSSTANSGCEGGEGTSGEQHQILHAADVS